MRYSTTPRNSVYCAAAILVIFLLVSAIAWASRKSSRGLIPGYMRTEDTFSLQNIKIPDPTPEAKAWIAETFRGEPKKINAAIQAAKVFEGIATNPDIWQIWNYAMARANHCLNEVGIKNIDAYDIVIELRKRSINTPEKMENYLKWNHSMNGTATEWGFGSKPPVCDP